MGTSTHSLCLLHVCVLLTWLLSLTFSLSFLKSLLWALVYHSPTVSEYWISPMRVPPHLAFAQCLYLKLHLGPEPGPI